MFRAMKNETFTILVVDDDENDQFMIRRTFKKISDVATIQAAHDGEEAIAYMKGEGKFHDRKQFKYPSFIMTDLKMPRADGFAVLQFLKSNPMWRIIPAVVLSASRDLDDIKKSYMLGASSYHVKPNDPVSLHKLLDLLYQYWMSCEVPQVDATGKQMQTDSDGKLGERFPQPI
jgi:CheY-like chemotaxis protein